VKAAVIEAPGRLVVREVPEPQPTEYQCLVDMTACATCVSTDGKLIEGDLFGAKRSFPAILGHESVGTVTQIGSAVRSFATGDVVLRPTPVYGGEKLGEFGSLWGGFAELGLVTDAEALVEDGKLSRDALPFTYLCHQKAPPELAPEDAAQLITLKETLSWLQDIELEPDRSLLIYGDGVVGLSFARWAKVMGARPVVVAGHHDDRLALAEELGADATVNTREQDLPEFLRPITGGKCDCIVEAIGAPELLAEAVRLVAPGGTIGVYGIAPVHKGEVNLSEAPGKWRLVQSYGGEPRAHQQVLDAVRLGLVDPSLFYSHVLPLDQVAEAFELLHSRQALKCVIML
jgi:threonine dehydrogenase-like Zn-dependent dehydrogenase